MTSTLRRAGVASPPRSQLKPMAISADSGPSADMGSSERYLQLRTLAVLYVTYGLFYFPRKADSIVKVALNEVEGFTVGALSAADSAYLSHTRACFLLVVSLEVDFPQG